jgi:hypothetical protein
MKIGVVMYFHSYRKWWLFGVRFGGGFRDRFGLRVWLGIRLGIRLGVRHTRIFLFAIFHNLAGKYIEILTKHSRIIAASPPAIPVYPH